MSKKIDNSNNTFEVKTIKRYEKMMEDESIYFFDVFEFEELIEHYIKKNDLKLGFDVCKIAKNQHPDSLEIQLKEAQLLIESGHLTQASKLLKQINLIEPNNIEIILLKGVTYGKIGDVKNSIKYFNKVLTLIPSGEHKADALFDISLTFIQIGRYEIAIKYLKQSYAIDNNNLSVIFDLAFCHERINEIEESRILYEKYVEEDPFSKIAWYNLGVVYNKLQLPKKSLTAYNYSIAIAPQFSTALYNKANILMLLKKYEQAIEVYYEFLNIESHNDTAYQLIGECYLMLNKNILALKSFRKATIINPENSESWYSIGLITLRKGKLKKSKNFIKKAITINKQKSKYWLLIAQIYFQLNNFKNSEKAYIEAIEIEPFKEEFWLDYSNTIFQQNNFEKAIKILQEAKEYTNEYLSINLRLAASYFSNKNENMAYRYLEQALKQDNCSYKDFYKYYPQAKINTKIQKFIAKFSC